MNYAIAIHGGAGAWDIRAKNIDEAVAACREAAAIGRTILRDGGSALDAVEQATWVLEDCPILDAGRGSYLNKQGEVEMDAIIMDGRDLNLGAVAAVQRVRHPISLARRIMLDTEHAFLVAAGADAFADAIGFPRCAVEELLVGRELELFKQLQKDASYETVQIFTEPNSMGTVGAVAIDRNGHVAAATSTGGTRHKMPGRVGDTPLVGSGAYADNWTAAVSSTGHGESLMKVVICKTACDFVGMGLSAESATRAAIHLLEQRTGGKGGLIAVDRRAQVGIAFNTDAMPHAWAVGNEDIGFGR
ncbi:MAG: isoaspartyl peptidase/L-asparaginase [Anaerolineae bacterium]|nr:isoaspartyl peptidase/L-asparaginase [Anaerolineae bacterium]MCO5192268.1 isoaspartyl peptidase/L-asparaginase [Anaerolineae bacterium]MCO5204150.1 isoaspartyl peptidase/L-asparaginase [Anaerolineae bacterium]